MLQKNLYNKLTWIDLESPTQDEVRTLLEEYSLHPLAAEELLLPSLKPKIDVYDDVIYLSLHFPALKHSHKEVIQEIDFIIGKEFMITARQENIDALHKFGKTFEVKSVLKKDTSTHGGHLFLSMLSELYQSLTNELDSVHDSLRHIEKKVFDGYEKEMVLDISKISREILTIKQATRTHKEILDQFKVHSTHLFEKEFSHLMESLIAEYAKIHNSIENCTELLRELRETNNSLLETKQGEIMKKFTVITLISAVLTIISGWFLIESPDKPFHGSGHEFWAVGIIMASVAFLIALVLKFLRWF